jgi:hypothetical protein
MISRVIALAITLVLFWSGFTTQERFTPLVSSHTERQVDGGQLPHVHVGSVDDHHLDDQPAPAQAEGAMEMPALVTARLDARVPVLTMAGPRPHAAATWLNAFLDGPQRPPCKAPLFS